MIKFFKSDESIDSNKYFVIDLPFYSVKSYCQHVMNNLELYTAEGKIRISFKKMFDNEHWILETNTVFLEDNFAEVYVGNIKHNLRLLVCLKTKFKSN